jgi:hypothetical protein
LTELALYREPIVLDYIEHRRLRLAPSSDHSMASGMHACFLTAAEFVHASREFVIVFVRDLVEGKLQMQPIVMLGLSSGENLFVGSTAGSLWDARYVPAYIRRYPFWTTRIEGLATPAVMIDKWWKGFSESVGDPLYEGENKPAPRLAEAINFLARFDVEVTRTLAFCDRIAELDLLTEMTVDVSMPDGATMALNGLFSVHEQKLRALPDATVVELHRNGMAGLLHSHLSSLGNLQALVDRKTRRLAGPPN